MTGFDAGRLEVDDFEADRFEVVCQLRIEQLVSDIGFRIGRGLLEAAFIDGVCDGAVEEEAQPFLDRSVVVDIYVE